MTARDTGRAARRATPAASAPASAFARDLVPLLFVFAAALVAGLPGFRIPFLSDDYVLLDAARRVPLPGTLWTPDPVAGVFRPVSRALWFGVLGPLAGDSPALFHAANLALFLGALALFWRLARAHAGARGALAATAILAVHFAFDVPLRVAGGNQDLLAIALALLALGLHAVRRDVLAGLALGFALLSHEVVAGTAFVAWALAWARGEDWGLAARRTLPLFAITGGWAVVWGLARGAVSPDAFAPTPLEIVFAPLAQFVRVAPGLEGLRPHGNLVGAGLLAAGLAVVAAAIATARPPETGPAEAATPARGRVVVAALVWVACAIVPVAPVVRHESAYILAWAVTGAAFGLAALFSAWPRPAMIAAVAALALLSQHARGSDAFIARPDAWATVSHVNRFAVEKEAATTRGMIDAIRRVDPPAAPHTLFLFGALPDTLGDSFARGGSAILRTVLRDTTLRAARYTEFRRGLMTEGPVRAINWRSGQFREVPAHATFLTLGSVLTELAEPDAAHDAFELSIERDTTIARPYAREFLGLMAWAKGDTAEARRQMREAGKGTSAVAPPARLDAMRAAFAKDDSTAAVLRALEAASDAPFDPALRAQLVDLGLARPGFVDFAAAQGYALCLLAPDDPQTWRRWTRVLAARGPGRTPQALAALAHFRALAPDSGRGDAEIDSLEIRLVRASTAP